MLLVLLASLTFADPDTDPVDDPVDSDIEDIERKVDRVQDRLEDAIRLLREIEDNVHEDRHEESPAEHVGDSGSVAPAPVRRATLPPCPASLCEDSCVPAPCEPDAADPVDVDLREG